VVEPNGRLLYRFEYLEEGERYTNWVWLEPHEVSDYLANDQTIAGVTVRKATAHEMELYDEAYNDGYDVAMVQEHQSAYNGLTFRLEVPEDGMDPTEFKSHKMFECGICLKHKDFEDHVGMADGFFISVAIEDTLWHVCYDCTLEDGEYIEFKAKG
jgi:hypothetical protein